MSALADLILRRDFDVSSSKMHSPKMLADVMGTIQHAHVFHIDNVAEYLFGGRKTAFYRTDFPEIRPPFPWTFFQYRMPDSVVLSDGTSLPMRPGTVGELLLERGRKVYVWRFVHEDGHRPRLMPVVFSYDLDTGEERHIDDPDYKHNNKYEDAVGWGACATTFFALSLLTCRNVKVVEHAPSQKLSKKRQKRGGPPLVKWSTLEIGPVTAVLDRARKESGDDSIRNALHICRGHFKTYEDRPLFGQIRGRFWWTPHVRGQASEGVRLHEFNISPKESA